MAQPQAAGWQQLLNGSGFEEVARLLAGPDKDRPFVLVPPHLYSKLTEAVDSDTPGHKRAAARGNDNEDDDDHNSHESAGAFDPRDQEVLQFLASSQNCTLQDLRLIPDETSNSRQGGQWTAGAHKWPGLIVFAVPSPLCHSADQQQGHRQHMSLVILSNAPALGQSMKEATKHSKQPPEGRAMLLHLDPHSTEPHPDCKQYGCPRCKSCVFQGAEPAAVLLPILMMLQRVIRSEGEAFRQASSSRKGRRNKMQQCNFSCGIEHQDHIHLYSVPVPPMLPLCKTATTRLAAVPGQPCCQCVGSCLVLLHWLSAWPPDQHDLDSRAAAVWNRSLEPWRVLPLSPAWYPPMYVDLLIRDLQALADLAQQQVQQQQQEEEEEEEQQQELEESSGRWQQQQQWSPDLQSLWKQVQRSRLQSGKLCYPGPWGHLAMLKQLTMQQMQQLWLAGFSWSEGHMSDCVQHLQHTIRGYSSARTTPANDGASSSAAAAAAASEATLDYEALAALMLPAITGDQRSLSIHVCNELAAGCKQFSAVPFCAIASVLKLTAEKRLRQLTVVQARAQRYVAKHPEAGQDDGDQAAGQQTPHNLQPGEQGRRQQGQPGEAGIDATEVEGGGAGGGGINDDDPDQYPDWRVQSSGTGDDEVEGGGAGGGGINDDDPDQYPDWRVQSSGTGDDEEEPCRRQLRQQQQQQQQCQQQQQQQTGLRVVVAAVDKLNVHDSPTPDHTAAQAPDRHWHQEQLPQQRPLPDPQHQVEQFAHEGQQAASASAAACNQPSLKQAEARLRQAGAGSAAAAPKQSTAVAEQACQPNHPSRKGRKAGGNSCIQQQQQQRKRQGAAPTANHKRQRDSEDTCKPDQCVHSDGWAAGAETSPSHHHHQPTALETTPRQTLVPKNVLKYQQQLKQQQKKSYERCTSPKAADISRAGPMGSLANSPCCSQKTTGAATAAGQVAGKTAAGAVRAAALGAPSPSTHPNGSPAGFAVTRGTGPGSGGMTREQAQASAAAQTRTPGSHHSKATAHRTQSRALVKLTAKSGRPRGHSMEDWKHPRILVPAKTADARSGQP